MSDHVYALKSWSIRKRGEQYFIAPTAQEGKHLWRGPYLTLQRAATAIARRLQWEFAKRQGRKVRS